MRKLAWALVAALLVVNLVLGVLIFQNTNETRVTSNESEEAPGTSAPIASPTADPARFDPPRLVSLHLGRDDTVVRTVRGSCFTAAAPSVEVSEDQGAEFTTLDVPVAAVLGVSVADRQSVTIVGADDDCAAVQYATQDGGQTWTQNFTVDQWHLAARGTEGVVSTQTESAPGCEVLGLHPLDTTTARVTCSDGTILGTGDGGESWAELGELGGLRRGSFYAPGNAVALAAYEGCGAQSFTTRDAGRTWSEGVCLGEGGAEALGASPTLVVAQVGGELFVSSDRGATWSQP